MLPLKESARARIVEVVRTLQPNIPEITAAWRSRMFEEFEFDGRVMAALERLNIGTGFAIFCRSDFGAFFEHLTYFGTRLAKLNVDTRAVARSLELYSQFCEKHLDRLSPMARAEGVAALESFYSITFVAVAGAYFDAQGNSSSTLLSVLDAELSSSNLNTLLDRILRTTTEAFHANLGMVLLREDHDEFLRPKAAVGIDLAPGLAVPLGTGFTGQIAQTGEPAILPDLEHTHGLLNPVLRQKSKALWGMPLRISDQVIGVLVMGFQKPYEWLPSEKELMRAIAERSALAIEKARFNDALRERELRIAELSAHLLRAQEDERKRISRELHDATGQQLMVIRLYLGMLDGGAADAAELHKKIHETVTVVDQTIEGIRRIIAKLSPLVLEELGLIAAIRKEAKDFTKRTGVRTRVAVSDSVGRLSNLTETAVYRVIQEALHNVAKHAQAKSVSLQLTRQGEMLSLVVQDDGVGITHAPVAGRNFGLAGMQERVTMLGGTVKVASAKNKGTRIEVKVPVTQRSESERGANRGDMRPFLVRRAAAAGKQLN
ncbi:MAG TPA: GAF domain-containing sensor histidine kinase [Terriglobales bacterium]|nr:GAF domain-containing sensor histidine kinase [Terriglobales bacterium]